MDDEQRAHLKMFPNAPYMSAGLFQVVRRQLISFPVQFGANPFSQSSLERQPAPPKSYNPQNWP
ncbi:hypothetical protein N7505_007486 [Penicillium chrysogenum]|uniref:Uncharacterized protein n=1 Tax=Penicillium chrysogenum TaxID=5076 RepID=A0ABQ8WDJ5_PENCH|nr:hypothetical protein N7505_007486 [Penicillium chrysogenum]